MLRILALAALAVVVMSGSALAQTAWTTTIQDNGKYRVSTVTLTSGTTPSAILQVDPSAIVSVHAAAITGSPSLTVVVNNDISATAAGAISPTLLNAVSVTTPVRNADIGVVKFLQARLTAIGAENARITVYELVRARQQ